MTIVMWPYFVYAQRHWKTKRTLSFFVNENYCFLNKTREKNSVINRTTKKNNRRVNQSGDLCWPCACLYLAALWRDGCSHESTWRSDVDLW